MILQRGYWPLANTPAPGSAMPGAYALPSYLGIKNQQKNGGVLCLSTIAAIRPQHAKSKGGQPQNSDYLGQVILPSSALWQGVEHVQFFHLPPLQTTAVLPSSLQVPLPSSASVHFLCDAQADSALSVQVENPSSHTTHLLVSSHLFERYLPSLPQ